MYRMHVKESIYLEAVKMYRLAVSTQIKPVFEFNFRSLQLTLADWLIFILGNCLEKGRLFRFFYIIVHAKTI